MQMKTKWGDTLPVHNDTSELLVLNPLGSVCAQNSVVAELPQGHKTFTEHTYLQMVSELHIAQTVSAWNWG